MSNLTQQLQDLNERTGEIVEMMRASAQARRREEALPPAPTQPWRSGEPRRLTAASIFLSLPGGAQMLRDEFKVVPENYYKVVDERTRITCPCGLASHLLDLGALCHCDGCGRFYYAGRVLRASSAEPQEQRQAA